MSPFEVFSENFKDVERLLEIHVEVAGEGKGRKYGVEVINKSAVVFICANWEAFIEDLARQTVLHISRSFDSPSSMPPKLQKILASYAKRQSHDLYVLKLSGDGWKRVFENHLDDMAKAYIGAFNTPKPSNIDDLFKNLIGLSSITDCWQWKGMGKKRAKEKLRDFVSVRGAIAHRGELDNKVDKGYVKQHSDFVDKLAVATSNYLRNHIFELTGSYPWGVAVNN
ncbi:HEPN domain-containing protein [Halomonas sp. B23F22_10]|uniref:HEPN domain-containing protein n=1 Tax=Halomonas sp. B23F22_10 TaxID=3459515 RepID=UPI00373F88C6